MIYTRKLGDEEFVWHKSMNRHYRPLWARAGYGSKEHPGGKYGSAAVVPPPSAEWFRAYHLCPAEYAISNIVFSRLKVGQIRDLNDPFELLAYQRGAKNKTFLDYRKEFDEKSGLLCFSEDWTDPVLWSHYAAKHGGMCLGFDIDRRLELRKVSYRTERLGRALPTESPVPMEIDEELAGLLLTTKFSSWSYEREWRVILPLQDTVEEERLRFYPIGEHIRLAEVIIGETCSIPWEQVRAVVKKHHPDASVIKARLAHFSFNVVPEEKTVEYVAP
ncbi:DUF2971 domain-containing protein [Bradyrhizobium barranii subsp. barranii]|uniref:DUF2971 domain-containing protein n=1 Tax=Bradyrhizobium barranii subsp. barranii TaxID=2823807 RepID=A0A7Z0TLU7_9BRAD|nr:DUF2971 domain-containing protein [Bradyrhizobium barranii]UGX93384.1 DUF2971 domain-containing protein [Bradyrhizobium barranii subsp. barranii]